MQPESAVLEAARRRYPGRHVRLEGEGQLSIAVRVDDELVVRYPRHAYGIERLTAEVALLERIRPHLSVAVPDIVDVGLDLPAGQAYVAHRYIPGRVLDRDVVAAWSPARLDTIAGEVADFLRDLHPLVDAGAPRLTPREFAAVLAAEFDALPSTPATDGARARVDEDLAALAGIPDTPALLCHTDLGGNIVVDERTDTVGIIDFGSCFVTHPAIDVASLSVLGDGFVDACAQTYPLLVDAARHAAAVRRTFALQDALYGARQDDIDYALDVLGAH